MSLEAPTTQTVAVNRDPTIEAPPIPVAPAPDAPLAERLEHQISWLWWALLRGTPAEMSRSAATVLAVLRADGPSRVTELAVRERCAQPSMTCLVNRLERDGHVERRPDPEDRRATRVTITPQGLEALEQRALARSSLLQGRLDELTEQQLQALEGALPALEILTAPERIAPNERGEHR
jgi:DNA-binding MarR family transcriptional regulator